MKIKNNQKGTGTIELILLVVVIAIIGFVGWFVWNNRASKSVSSPSTAQTNTQKEKSATPAKQAATYFEIKELGVKFEAGSNLKGLYYTMGNNNKTAYFSLEDLKNTECAADKTSQIALTRYTDADFEEDIQAQPQKDSAIKIENYYFIVASGQASCSEDMAVAKKASDMKEAIVKLLPSQLVKN